MVVSNCDGRSLVTLLKEHYANTSDLDEFEAGKACLGSRFSHQHVLLIRHYATAFSRMYCSEARRRMCWALLGIGCLRTTDNGARGSRGRNIRNDRA